MNKNSYSCLIIEESIEADIQIEVKCKKNLKISSRSFTV